MFDQKQCISAARRTHKGTKIYLNILRVILLSLSRCQNSDQVYLAVLQSMLSFLYIILQRLSQSFFIDEALIKLSEKKKNTEILKQMAHFLVCSSQTWCYSEYYFNLIIMFKKNHIRKMTLENNYNDLLHDDLQSDFTLKTVVTFHIYRLQMISTSGVLIF